MRFIPPSFSTRFFDLSLFLILTACLIGLASVTPAAGVTGDDYARGIAADSDGNVVVTGSSWIAFNYDYVTIKYAADGDLLWWRRYNGPANSSDQSRALAVDASGNVYITGNSYGGSTASGDFVTIKYDKDGNWIWGRRYNGSASSLDSPTALAVDAQGNVYVTGESSNGANVDYVIIKYDQNGTWLWGRRYNSPANGEDTAHALAVDGKGNVYVTGSSYSGFNWDYVTIKYSPDGNWLWGRRYNGLGNGHDSANALAVDAGGNIIVTGYSFNGANEDYVTIKYDPNGNWLWGRRYNGPGNGYDSAMALVLDIIGNVIVTGVAYDYDIVTIKYSSAGAWIWGKRYDSGTGDDDWPNDLALDSSGNIIITGDYYNSINATYDYLTIKYDSTGNFLWQKGYDGPSNYADDHAQALAVDGSNNVMVTGESFGFSYDYVTIKYDAAGNWLWGWRYDAPF